MESVTYDFFVVVNQRWRRKMWTETTRSKYERASLRYASDLTAEEWGVIGPLLPSRKRLGRPRTTEMREVVNAILYMVRRGCQWRMLPKDIPPRSTGFPKKGHHSVGVARQYCGQLGKQDNCQVAVSLSVATSEARLPVVHAAPRPSDLDQMQWAIYDAVGLR